MGTPSTDVFVIVTYVVMFVLLIAWGVCQYVGQTRAGDAIVSLLPGVDTVQDLASTDTAAGTWTCTACAFANNSAASACLLCGLGQRSEAPYVCVSTPKATTAAQHRRDWHRFVLPDGQYRWQHVRGESIEADAYVVHVHEASIRTETVAEFNARRREASEDVVGVHALSFSLKFQWFLKALAWLKVGQRHKFVTLCTTRHGDDVVQAMCRALDALAEADVYKPFSVRFDDEPGVDAGGLEREWYTLVASALFDPATGFFATTHGHTLEINAAMDPQWYRGIGRFIGRALFDGHALPARFNVVLLKHLVGMPFGLDDLRFVDPSLHASLHWLVTAEDHDVAALALDFSVLSPDGRVIDLVPGGRDVLVTNDNKAAFVARYVQYRCATRAPAALAAFLDGVNDIVPQRMLSVFDHEELRLVLCGLDAIDVADWKRHTFIYGGSSSDERTIAWFWDIVAGFSHAQRARLLQFVTGSPCVPFQGFRGLTTRDGKLCHFTLRVVPMTDTMQYPVARTCCNRLDLPDYKSKAVLLEALTLVAAMDVTGFSMA
ncbi:hypothetical protein SDRG_06866 [Saprolegnia diclina VS20]|uniref:HECT-type E3 ubiquitin transferase n=1 Tax=Saprolegnia diclina (strain VS20) TaxID=1156394 RepID=T0RZ26_SAPDV|nr:hypothetical protein SDRG_06866 [Saprolegnia diclina VS20]EQC35577.1 hypothetical protein SDRG_06866 [Saprolegnia diclina VS20]|eukprot:XP_008610894.1 hypothetical protein SDRG_06866 [Saprolegnia diclina VS20]